MSQNHTPNPSAKESDPQDMTRLTMGGTPIAGEFSPGDVIGGTYRVIRWIGAGGMGNVYRVQHTMMQQDYALKTLSADKITELAWRRFQNEAQAIARMHHPNLIGIYNLGLHENRLPYYVMDLLDGKSLLDEIKDNGPMEVNRALPLFIEVCAGLGYAHKKGIVHRDIKPPNILLLNNAEPKCHIKIVDFGIAKLSDVKDPANQFLTNAGEVCGSPYYMSPEQTAGQRIDARSDIYSLGCTLFEVLTGAPPLRGRSAVDTMLLHQTTPAPTLKAGSGGKEFPEMLERVIATLLAKAPMDRYQTMELVGQDLAAIIAGEQAAINPYVSAAPKPFQMADSGAKENKKTGFGNIVSSSEHNLEHRRRYDEEGGDNNGNDDQYEPEPSVSRLPLFMVGFAAALFVVGGISAFFMWQGQHKITAANAAPKYEVKADYDQGLLKTGAAQFSVSDTLVNRDQSNIGNPASAADKEPFSHITGAGRYKLKVFSFPTDITIGDISSKTRKSVPAKGRIDFPADDSTITFTPDPILVKFPQYYARFRPHDLYAIDLDGRKASDALVKLISALPGILRLELTCLAPNITKKSLAVFSKMKSVDRLQLNDKSLSPEDMPRLGWLHKLVNITLASQTDAEPYLKQLKSSPAIKEIFLEKMDVSREALEDVATFPNVEMLSLDSSKFSPHDLELLTRLPNLHAVYLCNCQLDRETITNLQKMKGLRMLAITTGSAKPIDDEKLKDILPGVIVQFTPGISDLPITSNL